MRIEASASSLSTLKAFNNKAQGQVAELQASTAATLGFEPFDDPSLALFQPRVALDSLSLVSLTLGFVVDPFQGRSL